jgi:hypothetical protein
MVRAGWCVHVRTQSGCTLRRLSMEYPNKHARNVTRTRKHSCMTMFAVSYPGVHIRAACC